MPSSTITVRYASTGKPAKNQRVVLSFHGVMSGGMSKIVITDSSGNATIQHEKKDGTADVIVDGRSCGDMRIPGSHNVNI